MRVALEKEFGTGQLTTENLIKIQQDIEIETKVLNLIGALEHMAIGMNTGVYDKDLLYRMSGSYLIMMYDRLKPYIEERQGKNKFAFIEYVDLVSNYKERKRIKPNELGTIKYSK